MRCDSAFNATSPDFDLDGEAQAFSDGKPSVSHVSVSRNEIRPTDWPAQEQNRNL
jgi:hypothetical protein